MPFLLSLKGKIAETMNTVILHLFYFPIAFISTLIFISWSAAILPIAFIKVYFHKWSITFTYSRIYRKSWPVKYLYVWTWLGYGIIICLINLIRDLIVFVIHLYSPVKKNGKGFNNAQHYKSPMLSHSLEITRRTLEKL